MTPLTAATTANTIATTGWPMIHHAIAAVENTAISTSALTNGSTRKTAFGERNSPHSRIASSGSPMPSATPGQGSRTR